MQSIVAKKKKKMPIQAEQSQQSCNLNLVL